MIPELPDEQYGGLFQEYELWQPVTQCLSLREATHICGQVDCNSHAILCSDPECLHCSQHSRCNNRIGLANFAQMFAVNGRNQRIFIQSIFESQDRMIDLSKRKRKRLIKALHFNFLSEDEKQTMQKIFTNHADITGTEVAKLYGRLLRYADQVNSEQNQEKLIEQLDQKYENIAAQIDKFKIDLFQKAHKPSLQKIEKINSDTNCTFFCGFILQILLLIFVYMLALFFCSLETKRSFDLATIIETLQHQNLAAALENENNYQNFIDNDSLPMEYKMYLLALKQLGLLHSKIVSPKKVQDVRFVFQALGKPGKMDLIYRASDHGCSASSFHQACDNIPNTFVMVKNQFGMTLAGYTPLQWKSTDKIQFVSDPEKNSFLLSIDRKEKMPLKDNRSGIRTSRFDGPGFGLGRDLMISNDCNSNNLSESLLCYSYACKQQFGYESDTWQYFSGSKTGRFSVQEIEVYHITSKGNEPKLSPPIGPEQPPRQYNQNELVQTGL